MLIKPITGGERYVSQEEYNTLLSQGKILAVWENGVWKNISGAGTSAITPKTEEVMITPEQGLRTHTPTSYNRDFTAGDLIRTPSDPNKVYYVEGLDQQRRVILRHIPDPQTFERLGFRWEDIKNLTPYEYMGPEWGIDAWAGEDLTELPAGIAAERGVPQFFRVEGGIAGFPEYKVFEKIGNTAVPILDEAELVGRIFGQVAMEGPITQQQIQKAFEYVQVVNSQTANTFGLEFVSREEAEKRYQEGEITTEPISEEERVKRAEELVEAGGETIIDLELAGLPPELQALYKKMSDYYDMLLEQGMMVNPEVEITPEKAAEFLTQAEGEFGPFFSGEIRAVKQDLERYLGAAATEFGLGQEALQREFKRGFEDIGISAAERGMALSGPRLRQEREYAEEAQRVAAAQRRGLEFEAGGRALTVERQLGTEAFRGITQPTIRTAPIITAQGRFELETGQYPLTRAIGDIYGQIPREQLTAEQTRAAELESAYRSSEEERLRRERLASYAERQGLSFQ